MGIFLYNVNDSYIEAISKIDSKIAHTKKEHRKEPRKYIGILLEINGFKYFTNLSSFKPKHKKMPDKVDFIKIEELCVINLNNMIPVVDGEYTYVNIANEKDKKYVDLLRSEYRIIKKLSNKIIKNANVVYTHKIKNGNETPLARRCCNFAMLENFAKSYNKSKIAVVEQSNK